MDENAIRSAILAQPELVLGDGDVMRSLVEAEAQANDRVTDLRGRVIARMEGRLGELERTHREVIAAAYDNLSAHDQVQRAVVALLTPTDFAGLLTVLQGEVADILAVDTVRLVLEMRDDERLAAPGLVAVPPGGIDSYIGAGRDRDPARITLRPTGQKAAAVFEEETLRIQSEALLRLDLGQGRRSAMLVFGASDPARFAADQGTDLLDFFASCFERAVRRWLA
ncbi:DUF484 family protein [Pontivivens insulae]|uniref:Uncharacterized protein n=1 Tax=Pontivivens insulae TaxID=1639689 RepID=A0A2R8AF40_9RHOB|nr:DUF484 family protein [Pontivivens insulae]RED12076.1 hypothetical protein DFR53_2789 [Pontivivens insulae]SPF30832.1 hypothetical protein POI8812_03176 [Pontivivens insulae]